MRDGGLPRTVCFYLHSANSTSKTAGLNADKISTNGKKSKKTSLKIRQKGQNKAFGQNICEKLFVHLNFYLLLRADWKCHATKQPSCAHFPWAFPRWTSTSSAAKAYFQRAEAFTSPTYPVRLVTSSLTDSRRRCLPFPTLK